MRTTLTPPGLTDERRQQIRAFLREYCPSLKDAEHPELVTIKGELMEVADIGLRVFVPRELANAQGFPPDYILDPFYTKVCKRGRTTTKRLSGSAQVRMIGNSVSAATGRGRAACEQCSRAADGEGGMSSWGTPSRIGSDLYRERTAAPPPPSRYAAAGAPAARSSRQSS